MLKSITIILSFIGLAACATPQAQSPDSKDEPELSDVLIKTIEAIRTAQVASEKNPIGAYVCNIGITYQISAKTTGVTVTQANASLGLPVSTVPPAFFNVGGSAQQTTGLERATGNSIVLGIVNPACVNKDVAAAADAASYEKVLKNFARSMKMMMRQLQQNSE